MTASLTGAKPTLRLSMRGRAVTRPRAGCRSSTNDEPDDDPTDRRSTMRNVIAGHEPPAAARGGRGRDGQPDIIRNRPALLPS